jgi:hypothetical protein
MDKDRGGAASALISAVASLLDAAIPPERSKRPSPVIPELRE